MKKKNTVLFTSPIILLWCDASAVDFEQINIDWVGISFAKLKV